MKISLNKVIDLYNQGLYDLKVSAQLAGISVIYFLESLFDFFNPEDSWELKADDWGWG
jgi:hypothetical protein